MDKIFIKTYGCSLNVSDSEVIAGFLKKEKFKITENEDEANLVIVNTCIVKEPTEYKILRYIEELKKKGKKIIVSGCMPQALPEKLPELSIIGTSQINRIVEVVEETMHGNCVVLIAKEKNKRLAMPRIRRNKIIEIIPICSGCLGNCSYCLVKNARGELASYEKKDIIEKAKTAAAEGAKEIWLTSQDTGCYGKDISETLPGLVKDIIKIHGNFKVRLGMANPNFVKEYIDELIPLLKSEKMFRYIHLPLQSGSNDVLKRMNRKYTVEEFIEIAKKLRKEMPDITIATDIICGFPGETEEQFMETLNVLEIIRPDIIYISKYWKRPHTDAAKLNQVPVDVILERSSRANSKFSWLSFERGKYWIGWQGEIIINELGKNGFWIGRNYAYRQIIINGNYKIGQKVKVKIINVAKYDLRAVEIKV